MPNMFRKISHAFHSHAGRNASANEPNLDANNASTNPSANVSSNIIAPSTEPANTPENAPNYLRAPTRFDEGATFQQRQSQPYKLGTRTALAIKFEEEFAALKKSFGDAEEFYDKDRNYVVSSHPYESHVRRVGQEQLVALERAEKMIVDREKEIQLWKKLWLEQQDVIKNLREKMVPVSEEEMTNMEILREFKKRVVDESL